MTSSASARFEQLCELVGRRGRGLTLRDLALVGAIVRALEAAPADHVRANDLAVELGVDMRLLGVAQRGDDLPLWGSARSAA